ncbi:MAG: DUF4160 domain-containing protein [bacterium]|nr:DUF4160 domain-containing protein [bacterium]
MSRFLGITIFMNFNDHNPPHFHAEYGGYQIIVEIESGVIEGKFPRRALRLVMEWHEKNRDLIMQNWHSISESGEFTKIQPLE